MLLKAEDAAVLEPDPLENPVAVKKSVVENRNLCVLLLVKLSVYVDLHAGCVLAARGREADNMPCPSRNLKLRSSLNKKSPRQEIFVKPLARSERAERRECGLRQICRSPDVSPYSQTQSITCCQAQSTWVPTPVKSLQRSPTRGDFSANSRQKALRPSSSISGINRTTRLFRPRIARACSSSIFAGARRISGRFPFGSGMLTASPASTTRSTGLPSGFPRRIFTPASSANDLRSFPDI